jgi:cytochrome P450
MTIADNSWKLSVAPGARPLLGHSKQLRTDPLGFLNSLHELGDIVVVKFGPSPVHFLTRHDLAHHVLVERSKEFVRGGPFFERSVTVMGNGLATSLGDEHKRQRRLAQPAFHARHLQTYQTVMRDEAEAMTAGWRSGQEIDLLKVAHDLTTKVTLRCFFSSDPNDAKGTETVEEAAAALDQLVSGMYKQMTAPVPALNSLPTAANRRYKEAVSRFHGAVDRLIADRRRSGEEHDDLLGLLMTAYDDETDTRFSDGELHDQVITFLSAGIDTTANMIAWALGLLAENPDARDRFHAEIDGHLGTGTIADLDVRKLTYTQAVLYEALRLYPPLWTMTREARVPVTLGGHRFAKGTQFGVSPYALQHDTRLFRDPERFDPERGEREDVPRTAIIPFGTGIHKCIGDAFAISEGAIVLATIARDWRLDLTPASSPLRPLTLMTLGPASAIMKAIPR